jgi:phosphoglycerate dehydrogenase-like enzyme
MKPIPNMAETPQRRFVVALTADFFDNAGNLKFRDVGLSTLNGQQSIAIVPMHGFHQCVKPEQLQGVQGAILMEAGADKHTVSDSENLLALARFGVGYNDIDVQACTDADVVFFTAAGGVDRSMAEATVGWMISLGHRFRAKDLLVRSGRWDQASDHVGVELRDRTFGTIGFGGIGRATVELLQGFGMSQPLAYDPYCAPETANRLGVKMVPLDELMRSADFVSIHCPLNDGTRNLVGRQELALMKPEAFIINTARGGIINEDALFEVLEAGHIAGAAIDVFVGEPFDKPHRFSVLDNVLLAPHAVGLTHEIYRDIGKAVCRGMVDVALGRQPRSVINPDVFDRPSFGRKWARLRVGAG